MVRKLAWILYLLLALPGTAFGWTAPIGVPAPSWPSDLDVARPTMPSPWTSDQAGWYFIQTSGCSDSRTYGNPTASRCTIPSSPAAGSKIVLNGTLTGNFTITYAGSSGSPIWIMGYSTSTKPSLTGYWDFDGSYLIVDSLSWSMNQQDGCGLGGSYTMIRDCTLANTYDSANGAGFVPYGSNVIVYRLTISQMGNWQYSGAGDIDRHGIKVVSPAADVWIIDSTFYHCHGDGIQVGDQNNSANQINRIYISR